MIKGLQIFKLIREQERQEQETINLIPSENYVSKAVLKALGSVFNNKYSEGYPGRRYYAGNETVDRVEILCQKRALELFGLSPKKWQVNVQPYSGSPANLAVYLALVPLGGKIMGMQLQMGGHLTHGHAVSATGKLWKQASYGVDKKTEKLNYNELLKIAKREKPRLIVVGYTAYSRIVDFKAFRKIADSCGAYLMADMSHFAGLVAGRAYPSPFPYADVVMTTTHKTLRGPRGAIIFSKKELTSLIDKAVFPGLQGGPHDHQTAAVAVALQEANNPGFRNYAKQIIKNAKILSEKLADFGWRIVSGGTDTHLFLVDTWQGGVGGKEASERLEKVGIVVNKNTIPFDARAPFDPSGIRIGTPAVTTRGMKEKEMKKIAVFIDRALKGENSGRIRKEVLGLCKDFPIL